MSINSSDSFFGRDGFFSENASISLGQKYSLSLGDGGEKSTQFEDGFNRPDSLEYKLCYQNENLVLKLYIDNEEYTAHLTIDGEDFLKDDAELAKVQYQAKQICKIILAVGGGGAVDELQIQDGKVKSTTAENWETRKEFTFNRRKADENPTKGKTKSLEKRVEDCSSRILNPKGLSSVDRGSIKASEKQKESPDINIKRNTTNTTKPKKSSVLTIEGEKIFNEDDEEDEEDEVQTPPLEIVGEKVIPKNDPLKKPTITWELEEQRHSLEIRGALKEVPLGVDNSIESYENELKAIVPDLHKGMIYLFEKGIWPEGNHANERLQNLNLRLFQLAKKLKEENAGSLENKSIEELTVTIRLLLANTARLQKIQALNVDPILTTQKVIKQGQELEKTLKAYMESVNKIETSLKEISWPSPVFHRFIDQLFLEKVKALAGQFSKVEDKSLNLEENLKDLNLFIGKMKPSYEERRFSFAADLSFEFQKYIYGKKEALSSELVELESFLSKVSLNYLVERFSTDKTLESKKELADCLLQYKKIVLHYFALTSSDRAKLEGKVDIGTIISYISQVLLEPQKHEYSGAEPPSGIISDLLDLLLKKASPNPDEDCLEIHDLSLSLQPFRKFLGDNFVNLRLAVHKLENGASLDLDIVKSLLENVYQIQKDLSRLSKNPFKEAVGKLYVAIKDQLKSLEIAENTVDLLQGDFNIIYDFINSKRPVKHLSENVNLAGKALDRLSRHSLDDKIEGWGDFIKGLEAKIIGVKVAHDFSIENGWLSDLKEPSFRELSRKLDEHLKGVLAANTNAEFAECLSVCENLLLSYQLLNHAELKTHHSDKYKELQEKLFKAINQVLKDLNLEDKEAFKHAQSLLAVISELSREDKKSLISKEICSLLDVYELNHISDTPSASVEDLRLIWNRLPEPIQQQVGEIYKGAINKLTVKQIVSSGIKIGNSPQVVPITFADINNKLKYLQRAVEYLDRSIGENSDTSNSIIELHQGCCEKLCEEISGFISLLESEKASSLDEKELRLIRVQLDELFGKNEIEEAITSKSGEIKLAIKLFADHAASANYKVDLSYLIRLLKLIRSEEGTPFESQYHFISMVILEIKSLKGFQGASLDSNTDVSKTLTGAVKTIALIDSFFVEPKELTSNEQQKLSLLKAELKESISVKEQIPDEVLLGKYSVNIPNIARLLNALSDDVSQSDDL